MILIQIEYLKWNEKVNNNLSASGHWIKVRKKHRMRRCVQTFKMGVSAEEDNNNQRAKCYRTENCKYIK